MSKPRVASQKIFPYLGLALLLGLSLLTSHGAWADDAAGHPTAGEASLLSADRLLTLEHTSTGLLPAADTLRVPHAADPRALGGFRTGDQYFAGAAAGEIARLAIDGLSQEQAWATLPGESGRVVALHLDSAGAFGRRLLAATENGTIWTVGPEGSFRLITETGLGIRTLVTTPNDLERYGAWAGKLLVGLADQDALLTVDGDGATALWSLGFQVADSELVHPGLLFHDQSRFATWTPDGRAMDQLRGEILLAPESGALVHARWNEPLGTFDLLPLTEPGQWRLSSKGLNGSPSLLIPKDLPASAGEPIDIPIYFEPEDSSIGAMAFSIDIDDCLDFDPTDADDDGLPDSILFKTSSASGSPRLFASYDARDEDGELDLTLVNISIPIPAFAEGELMAITLTPTCEPPFGGLMELPVGFSSDPKASFGGTDGSSIPGETMDGSLIVTSGTPGDCNSDGVVDAGDLVACILEIFDGDGEFWLDTPGGDFAGSPVGCDANGDGEVDSGDFSCKVNLIFQGPGSCGAPDTTALGEAPKTVSLIMPPRVFPNHRGFVEVPLYLRQNGTQVNSMVFSIDYDRDLLSLDGRDRNGDGVPDSIRFNTNGGVVPTVILDNTDINGELDMAFLSFDSPLSSPGNKPIATLIFRSIQVNEPTLTKVRFSHDPGASFGDLGGRSVDGQTTDSTVYLRPRN